MTTLDSLQATGEAQVEAAINLCEASDEFTRRANGNRGNVIPAPVAYDLIGNLKVTLRHVQEAAGFLPRGLENSLCDERLAVYDVDPATGAPRDPARQVNLAGDNVREVAACLDRACILLEAAQVAINSQGYKPSGR